MSEGASETRHRRLLTSLFGAALGAVGVEGRLAPFLPPPPRGRTVVIGAGKAAGAMAAELCRVWQGPLSGAVVTAAGCRPPGWSGPVEILEAGHPVPDARSVAAGAHIRALTTGLTSDDLVIALISGGASSLMVGLPDGVSLADKQALTARLLASGAAIGETNQVRRQVSTLKGGRLGQLCQPAHLITLAISDIPGDDIAAIGSGPTAAPATRGEPALSILGRYGIAPPAAILYHLAQQAGGDLAGEQNTPRSKAHILARPADALEGAAARARAQGFEPVILGDALEGEARLLGAAHAGEAIRRIGQGRRSCLISGGETSVTLTGKGRGGRNGEYVLGALLELAGHPGISLLAADTDGIDGAGDNAGAFAFASSLPRAAGKGLHAARHLADNDSYSFFAALGDLLITGPSGTNVNDFRAILIDPA